VFVDHQVGFLFGEKFFPRLLTAAVMIVSPITYFLYANHVRTPFTFKAIIWCAIAIGTVYAATYNIIYFPKFVQVAGQVGAWISAFALGQALCNTNLKWYIRLAMFGVIAAWIRVDLSLGVTWLSGWVPLVMVIGIMMILRDRRMLIVAAIAVGIYGATHLAQWKATFDAEDKESGDTRSAAWAQAFQVAGDHLFLGTGPAGYHFYYTAYGIYRTGVNLSHNNYVDIISETGLLGTAAWMTYWLSLGIMAWKLYKMPIKDPGLNGLKFALVSFYPVIFVVMMLGDWVTPFPYTQTLAGVDYTIWNWILPGLMVALYHYGREEQARALQTATEPIVE
jgi:O-antigen ligase